MVGERRGYREKSCAIGSVLRGLICREINARSAWEIGDSVYN